MFIFVTKALGNVLPFVGGESSPMGGSLASGRGGDCPHTPRYFYICSSPVETETSGGHMMEKEPQGMGCGEERKGAP